MITLTFQSGPDKGYTLNLSGSEISFGRHKKNDVVIGLPTVSGRHGRLYLEEGQWLYQDLMSSNGTVVRHADGAETKLQGLQRVPVEVDDGARFVFDQVEVEIKIVEIEEEDVSFDCTILDQVGLSSLADKEPKAGKNTGRTLMMLHKFMRFVSRNCDVELILRELLRYAPMVTKQAERALLVDLNEEGQPVVRQAVDRKNNDLEPDKQAISKTLAWEVMRGRDGLLVTDVGKDLASSTAAELNIVSAMGVPLWDGDRVDGVVIVDSTDAENPFSSSDLPMLMFFVHHASVAINQVRLIDEMSMAFETSVTALMRVLDMRDPHTSAHSLKVRSIALDIAHAMKLPEEQIEVIRYAGMLHDLGKVAIPDEILLGHKKLTDQQRKIMNDHVLYTKELLSLIQFPSHLADVPLVASAHHERLDGKGPLGLQGEQIPLEARILGVADVFEALTATRSYKDVRRFAEAIGTLREMAENHLDQTVIDALEKTIAFN